MGGNILVRLLEGDGELVHGLQLLRLAGAQDIPQEEDVRLRIANSAFKQALEELHDRRSVKGVVGLVGSQLTLRINTLGSEVP